jgi:hypothetical protein
LKQRLSVRRKDRWIKVPGDIASSLQLIRPQLIFRDESSIAAQPRVRSGLIVAGSFHFSELLGTGRHGSSPFHRFRLPLSLLVDPRS